MATENEYHPWEESGESELDYFRRRFLEESARAERLEARVAEAERLVEEAREAVASLPQEALGYGSEPVTDPRDGETALLEWPIRDELHDKLSRFLAGAPAAPPPNALADAVLAYDDAIRACADDPSKMASFCTAQGDTLDKLYADMLRLAGHPERADEASDGAPAAPPKVERQTTTEEAARLHRRGLRTPEEVAVVCQRCFGESRDPSGGEWSICHRCKGTGVDPDAPAEAVALAKEVEAAAVAALREWRASRAGKGERDG